MFNEYFKSEVYSINDLSLVVRKHDLKLLYLLDVMLYGIVF